MQRRCAGNQDGRSEARSRKCLDPMRRSRVRVRRLSQRFSGVSLDFTCECRCHAPQALASTTALEEGSRVRHLVTSGCSIAPYETWCVSFYSPLIKSRSVEMSRAFGVCSEHHLQGTPGQIQINRDLSRFQRNRQLVGCVLTQSVGRGFKPRPPYKKT